MEGLIIKGIGGFYYVKSEDKVWQCRARGIFKNEGIVPTVGDQVLIEVLPDGDGVVNEILPRRNSFIRPPISSVDLLIIVIAAAKPKLNKEIIDKFLVMAEKSNTDIALCINKIDIAEENTVEELINIYSDIYPLCCLSGKTGEGTEKLKNLLKDKKTALAGPSGVGKSTLLNYIQPGICAETGDISQKTKRGRHTTRHVEIFNLNFGGMVFDTPGFTSFQVLEANEEELEHFYPEMETFIGKCKYDNCRHIKEPDCAIIKAVSEGKISKSRYDSYVSQLLKIRENNKY